MIELAIDTIWKEWLKLYKKMYLVSIDDMALGQHSLVSIDDKALGGNIV